jgi:hypothetical protein
MITDEQRAEIEQAIKDANFQVGIVESLVPASQEAFDAAGAWERSPYTVLRAIYGSLRDQQHALDLVAKALRQP